MDLKQLEYFVRVAELGSFTKASLALDVAQPALSRQVRLLEVELRQNLLIRNGRGATPTEAGKLLLEHGRGILHQVERAREELGRVRGALAGRVAIGLPPSLARVLAVPLTRAFREQLPEARLSITEGLSTTTQEWLVTGRLDIALLYNAQPAPDIEITPLQEEGLLLVEPRPPGLAEDPPAPPVTLAEVAALPLVIPSRPNAIRMQVENRHGRPGPAPDRGAGDRRRARHPGPGGRRRGCGPALAQRGGPLGPPLGLPGAQHPAAAAHAPVHGGQLAAPVHPDATDHADPDPADAGVAGLRPGVRHPPALDTPPLSRRCGASARGWR